ncbi:hypothetical protein JCM8097_007803 [Rhodosporidiobolus ruineniae]
MAGYPQPVTSPYAIPSPLTAPRAQPPPSQIPTDRLSSTADAWARGSTASPAPPSSLYPSIHAQSGPPMQPIVAPPAVGYPYQQPYAAGGPPPPPPQPNANANGHLQRPMSYSVGGAPAYGQPAGGSMHGRPASYAAPPPGPYGALSPQPPLPPQAPNGYFPPQPPPPPPPPQQAPGYLSPAPSGGFVPPPRAQSMQPGDFAALQQGIDGLNLGGPPGGYVSGGGARPNYYQNPEDGPPHKLSVTHPDQKMLASMRETAHANGGDVHKKVAWSKQVLKFIERHQASAGESSRISDPTLVRWTDEALSHILASASSSSPVPLALFLRGDLSASGSFPSYRSKDAKSSFRDFEAAANAGYVKAWFRIGRAYEDFGDVRRAVGAYEKGVEKGDCGSTYRLAMAYLLGQIGVQADVPKALALLKRAADSADLDTPQPPYILGMLLSGEFDSPSVQLNKALIPLDLDEAKWRIERSAYLSFGPAQYKMGFAYEYATLGCLFDPLLSVQYYALASQNGEVEADMALSKWYLCGSDGNFDKNEALAVTFAEKAAARQLPAAEFALGYFHEVGINGPIELDKAKRWYTRAAGHGNDDAKKRLEALQQSNPETLNRTDHDAHVETKLVRKRTQAKLRSDEQRERAAAAKLTAKLQGPNLGASSASSSPAAGQGFHHPHQQQQQHPPAPHQPLRQSTTSTHSSGGSSYPSASLRRGATMRQVEAAAQMGPRPPATPNPGINRYPSPAPGGPGARQSYQLSDAPSPGLPKTQRPAPGAVMNVQGGGGGGGGGGGRPAEIPVRQQGGQAKPSTFAEMGIATQKAKKDDCIIC